MTIDEFKNRIREISEINVCKLYLLLKVGDTFTVKIADLDNGETQTSLPALFSAYLREYIIENEELELCNLSTSEERQNAIYEYDFETYPDELKIINDFHGNDPDGISGNPCQYDKFDFQCDTLSSLYGFIIHFGDANKNMVLFKKFHSFSLIKREAFLMIKSHTRFKKLETDDILRLSGKIELLKLNEKLFVLDIKTIEKSLGFAALMQRDADVCIDKIKGLQLVEDVETLSDLKSIPAFMRKFAKIAKTSAVFQKNINKSDILNFIQSNPVIKSKFKYTEDGLHLRLDTLKAKKEFLKLLSDSFLVSELTAIHYEAIAKDTMDL